MQQVDIYTKAFCPFCTRAKALLEEKGVAFHEVAIDAKPQLREEMIERANGGWTVPQIFIGDLHIGGCDELMALERQQKLDALLQSQ
ncbi:glutaredoxin 3 [Alteromonas halophila]|uniref:Glutaredoxin n=1 Tax=Alteromonas halophila TaxID=516698 RepID=A0A918MXH3_9ALTE|nr:glutaredoxin 3 [Alteromonas halophila]GGW79097.1 glutaredoxin [Alteromonas halophila]